MLAVNSIKQPSAFKGNYFVLSIVRFNSYLTSHLPSKAILLYPLTGCLKQVWPYFVVCFQRQWVKGHDDATRGEVKPRGSRLHDHHCRYWRRWARQLWRYTCMRFPLSFTRLCKRPAYKNMISGNSNVSRLFPPCFRKMFLKKWQTKCCIYKILYLWIGVFINIQWTVRNLVQCIHTWWRRSRTSYLSIRTFFFILFFLLY